MVFKFKKKWFKQNGLNQLFFIVPPCSLVFDIFDDLQEPSVLAISSIILV